jgi:Tol biopolymer transport system component/DNA-binding winged helix-turn-helix (wHTH) protein
MRYAWDDFVLDLDTFRLERAGTPLSLEPKAFNLLALMVQRPGHLFTKQEIFERLWPDTAVTDHALTRVVAQVRRVLGDEAREARYLQTVPTRGYRFIGSVTTTQALEAPFAPDAHLASEPPEGFEKPYFRSAGLAAAFGLGLAVILFIAWAARYAPSAADAMTIERDPRWPVQVTTHGGLDMHPAISPQGDAIAFASDRSGAFEIYVRGLTGNSREVPLTSDGHHNVQPAWSPDGRFIAYHSLRHGGIWVIAARGGTPRQLVPVGAKPAWSPDGGRLAYQTDEQGDTAPNGFSAQAGSRIWIVDANGQNARQVTAHPRGGHASPSWSPDGRSIVFSVFDAAEDNGIWTRSVESGETWPLHRALSLYDPVFTRDQSAVYVAGADALLVRIPIDPRTHRPSGRAETLPVAGVPGVRGLSISSDGSRLALAGLSLDSQIWMLSVGPDGTSRGDASALTSDTSRRNSLPVVSPDGKKIAYMSIRRGELPNVWLMDADGRNAIQLTADETAEHKPSWFRDSRRVAYLSKRGRTGGIWSIDIETRREELIVDLAGAARAPGVEGRLAEFQLSPSMRRIAFSLLAPPAGERRLYVSETKPFAPVAIGSPDLSAGYPSWSPDEKFLAVEIKDGPNMHAGVVDLEAGSVRQLTNARGQTWVRSWSPDSSKIAVAAQREGTWSLRWVDARSGTEVPFGPAFPPRVYVRYPEWSPAGDRVLFERGEIRGNIWTLAID